MTDKIECYRCEQCTNLIPLPDSSYIVMSGASFKQNKRYRSWSGQPVGPYSLKPIIEPEDAEKVFCSVACVNRWVTQQFDDAA